MNSISATKSQEEGNESLCRDQMQSIGENAVTVPAYLRDVYSWAYLDPRNVKLLDRQIVVDTLLFLNARRLMQAAMSHVPVAGRTLMAAHVYGELPVILADHVGPGGTLDVVDVASIQVERCWRKIAHCPWVSVRHADAENPGRGPYDTVLSFMLLHEVPSEKKSRIINALLDEIKPGGRVIFVDYHDPDRRNPVRYLLSVVNDLLEPFAKELWTAEIRHFARDASRFAWSKQTYFGGVYQLVEAKRSP